MVRSLTTRCISKSFWCSKLLWCRCCRRRWHFFYFYWFSRRPFRRSSITKIWISKFFGEKYFFNKQFTKFLILTKKNSFHSHLHKHLYSRAKRGSEVQQYTMMIIHSQNYLNIFMNSLAAFMCAMIMLCENVMIGAHALNCENISCTVKRNTKKSMSMGMEIGKYFYTVYLEMIEGFFFVSALCFNTDIFATFMRLFILFGKWSLLFLFIEFFFVVNLIHHGD